MGSLIGDLVLPALLAGRTARVFDSAVLLLPTYTFIRSIREVVEMAYEFETDFVVDSSAIATELGVHATPIDTAIAITLDSYR